MTKPNCCIRLGGTAPQLSQIAAGFSLLEQRGLLRIRSAGVAPLRERYGHDCVLEADFGRGVVLAYDLGSQPEVPEKALSHVIRYFKRCCPIDCDGHEKLRPLGLGYHVTCRGNFFDRLDPPPVACPRVAEDYLSHNSYPAYKVLFVTGLRDVRCEEDERENRLRVAIIRTCRQNFGERFCGGLEDSELARATVPELILPDAETRREVFLRRLKENYVCVTADARNLAEFTAAGRAIVSRPLRFRLPGKFAGGRNYVTYDSADDCLRRLGELLGNAALVHRMEAANFAYHNVHVRPDALVLHTLRDAMPEIFV